MSSDPTEAVDPTDDPEIETEEEPQADGSDLIEDKTPPHSD